ncbi:carbon monoxide dehydrogenase subunit G [Variovorax rhizosphaerae]|uniref:Carbon monoxide dehydrogenase subunit G n=1 Tax=Variovorax rhizosphaerae TaxID=1836200 RepID=A0ABU8WXK7_9BURK
MEITGTQTIAAPRQRVWEALNDPAILKKSLPGCESVERTSAEEFKVIVAAAIGPLRARFNGLLKMSDIHAPESCTMLFEGQGGAIGFGKGNSSVKLTESDGQTELTYTAEAQVGGKLAQVGSRLIDSVARKMADDFFKAFKAQLAGVPEAAKDASAAIRSSLPLPLGEVGGEGSAAPAGRAAPKPPGLDDARTPTAPAAPAVPLVQPTANVPAGVVLVPGWWLAIAAGIGSFATLAGVMFAR